MNLFEIGQTLELIPRGFEPFRVYDIDGDVTTFAGDGTFNSVLTIKLSSLFYLRDLSISVYDPAIVPAITWDIRVAGVATPPFQNRHITGLSGVFETSPKLLIEPQTEVRIMAAGSNAILGGVNVDVLAAVRGYFLRQIVSRKRGTKETFWD